MNSANPMTRTNTLDHALVAPNILGPVVISNKRRSSWTYRCRDAALTLFTLGLWCLVLSQTYLQMADAELLLKVEMFLGLLEIVGLNFVIVFGVIHVWVMYERLLHWARKRRQKRREARG
ncbi:hypothetical protein QWY79_15300 [Halomonas sabkhae]|uniref:hypothetical protein n=1 Tax=Halomonas sabkhae TaxID=626223 RepID=UPI0025B5EE1D|nr:hypothetical protein [Halomonas sabkhae]MDN3526637.1 hypothetical protein [Halomonas sabkhae]